MVTDEEFQELQHDTMAQCEKYFNAFAERFGKKGFIWLEDNGSHELMIYTRGEYTTQLQNFLATLK